MTERTEFILDIDDSNREEQIRACRVVLDVLRSDAHEFEAEISGGGDDWPAAVKEAAQELRRVTLRPGSLEPHWAQTGVLRHTDEDIWDSYVNFAPYATDATVWDVEKVDIASLSDKASSIVVKLTPPQFEAVAAVVGEATLVPLTAWNARLRETRRIRMGHWVRSLRWLRSRR